jgi:hypothetical protein
VYEGDKVSIFGALSYNTEADQWEIEKPIAILLRKSVEKLKNKLWWKKIGKSFKSFFLGALSLLALSSMFFFFTYLRARIID